MKMRFAAAEPIRFTFADGRARITIRLASLSKGRRKRWRNVTVRGDYLPDRTAVDAYLFREGTHIRLHEQLGPHFEKLEPVADGYSVPAA